MIETLQKYIIKKQQLIKRKIKLNESILIKNFINIKP